MRPSCLVLLTVVHGIANRLSELVASTRLHNGYLPRSIQDELKMMDKKLTSLDLTEELRDQLKTPVTAIHLLHRARRRSVTDVIRLATAQMVGAKVSLTNVIDRLLTDVSGIFADITCKHPAAFNDHDVHQKLRHGEWQVRRQHSAISQTRTDLRSIQHLCDMLMVLSSSNDNILDPLKIHLGAAVSNACKKPHAIARTAVALDTLVCRDSVNLVTIQAKLETYTILLMYAVHRNTEYFRRLISALKRDYLLILVQRELNVIHHHYNHITWLLMRKGEKCVTKEDDRKCNYVKTAKAYRDLKDSKPSASVTEKATNEAIESLQYWTSKPSKKGTIGIAGELMNRRVSDFKSTHDRQALTLH
jgi:hypothetical protein